MADTRPTPVSFFGALRLCVQLLVRPEEFKKAEREDQTARNNYTDPVEPPHRADTVRAAFFKSLLLVLGFSALGFAAGKLMHVLGRCATPETSTGAQVLGAALLLWGTLFVRGWEIQSFSGVQFTERVNQWLYRALYCLGTAVVVYSLSFPQCGS
jgi:cytochrome c biogenesis protein CcdA